MPLNWNKCSFKNLRTTLMIWTKVVLLCIKRELHSFRSRKDSGQIRWKSSMLLSWALARSWVKFWESMVNCRNRKFNEKQRKLSKRRKKYLKLKLIVALSALIQTRLKSLTHFCNTTTTIIGPKTTTKAQCHHQRILMSKIVANRRTISTKCFGLRDAA